MPKKGKGRKSRKAGKGQFKAGREGEERNVEENPGKKMRSPRESLEKEREGEGEMREIREKKKKKKKSCERVTLGSVGWTWTWT